MKVDNWRKFEFINIERFDINMFRNQEELNLEI